MNKRFAIFTCLLSLTAIISTANATVNMLPQKAAVKKHSQQTKSKAQQPSNTPLVKRKDVQAFIDMMVKKYDFNRQKLNAVFTKAKVQPIIITSIKKPYEAKPWYEYRPIFLTDKRVNAGVKFWQQNQKALSQAEKTYGVPASVIVAIIGVETFYGKNTGKFSALDALSTLAFDYPPRAKFFRKELVAFLLLTREENIDPTTVLGSYAGAMGLPQFMPSSYRHYAVDFNGNGNSNIFNNPADAVGSIANYLRKNGWQAQQPIAEPAKVKDTKLKGIETTRKKPKFTLQQLQQHGITGADKLPLTTPANFVELASNSAHPEYWLAFHNFYVITRYNTSILYAMAVYQLSQQIQHQYQVAQAQQYNKVAKRATQMSVHATI